MIPHRRRVQSLLDKPGRREHHQFLVEGVRLIEELFGTKVRVERLYHVPGPPGTRLAGLLERARERGIPLAEVTPDELLTLSDTQTPQGIVAVADVPRWEEADVWTPRSGEEGRTAGDVLVLDGVHDPGNLGTLIRTAEAANVRGILVTLGTVEPMNPKVVRSAMGALFRLPMTVAPSPERVKTQCREAGLPLVLTSVHGGEPAYRLGECRSIALVLGGEAEGASPAWEPLADLVIRLPMSPATESLNVATAGGIVLFRHIWYPPGPEHGVGPAP